MRVGQIRGATRVLAKDQPQYRQLPIRDYMIGEQRFMMSEWYPTAEQVAMIVMGAPINLSLMGTLHPPVLLEVGEVPASAAVMDVDGGTGPSQALFNYRVKLRAHPHAMGKFVRAPNEHNAKQKVAEELMCSVEDLMVVADNE